MANSKIDIMKLALEVNESSKSGELSRSLLNQGHTLYGKDPLYPDYLIEISPNGSKVLGHWKNGKFEADICLLPNH